MSVVGCKLLYGVVGKHNYVQEVDCCTYGETKEIKQTY